MEKAYYGENGDYVDLKTFVERLGFDDKAWNVQPICKGCGEKVIPVNIKSVFGFREVSNVLLQHANDFNRKVSSPHFRHYDGQGDDCPYGATKDPFYDYFRGARCDSHDYKIKSRVSKLLDTDVVRQYNDRLLKGFLCGLTNRKTVPSQEIQELHDATKPKIATMTVLLRWPWIAPFAQILLAGSRRVELADGYQTRQFKPEGQQFVRMTSPNGTVRTAFIPEKICLNIHEETRCRRGDYISSTYEISIRHVQELLKTRLDYSGLQKLQV